MLLGIDTTNSNLCYGLADLDHKIIAYENIYPCRNAAEILAPKIALLFQKYACSIHDITKIISVTGPGGFSGVRIGTSFITGLTIGTNITITAIDALQALALSMPRIQQDQLIISCLDARRDHVYLNIYNHHYHALIDTMLIHLDDLSNTLKPFQNKPYYLTGHGIPLIKHHLNQDFLCQEITDDLYYPKAELFTTRTDLMHQLPTSTPLYLRDADAKLPQKK